LIVQHNTRCRIVNAYARLKGETADADYQFIGYLMVGKGRGSIFNHRAKRVASTGGLLNNYSIDWSACAVGSTGKFT